MEEESWSRSGWEGCYCQGGGTIFICNYLGGGVLIHHTFLTTPAPLWDVINVRSLTKYMKRDYNTILDDTDSADRHNFVPSQSFTGCSPGYFSQGDQ